MKKINLFLIILGISLLSNAQDEATNFTGSSDRERAQEPISDRYNYVPNEILVKFKDDVQITSGSLLKSAGINNVDLVLRKYSTEKLEKLFPNETKLKSAKVVKSPQGQDMVIPSLHNIYKIVLPELKSTGSMPSNIQQVIEELKALPEVEYAEPNYIYSVDDLEPVGPEITSNDLNNIESAKAKSSLSAVVPNDPLYAQQTYISAVKADLVWEQTTGDTAQVIAIIDTGVDWNHPDLKNKIWHNPGEIPGNGQDDDGNGLIDDYMGWDYINNDNNPMDDNSHGTHVAGIAAAESNNGIGIAGVNWKAKIMPVKVFNHAGYSDVSTISQGISYAFFKGSTVLNMSFGSFARSLTMEAVLQNAYFSSVLVAAAGNSALCIGPGFCKDSRPGFPFYPAGLSYVLGVQADADFSNYDQDGKVFSQYTEGYNYELLAPPNGLSTTPQGNYRILTGTSMSCPMVAGIAAIYKGINPECTTGILWGNFVHSSESMFDAQNACFPLVIQPILDLFEYTVNDTIGIGDSDNLLDAGETISLGVKIRNTMGLSDSTYVILKKNINSDPGDINIILDTVFIGSISTYATKTNQFKPLMFTIGTTIKNGKFIPLDIIMKNGENGKEYIQTIHIKVYNGVELLGVMDSTLTLTPDKLWIINHSFRVGANGFLKIMPGTNLILYNTIVNRGIVEAYGTKDSMIIIEGPNSIGSYCGYDNNGTIKYDYVHFKDLSNTTISAVSVKNCIIENFYTQFSCPLIMASVVENTIIKNSKVPFSISSGSFIKNNVVNNVGINDFCVYNASNDCMYNNFYSMNGPGQLFRWIQSSDTAKVNNNNFVNFSGVVISTFGLAETVYFPRNYWGSTDPQKIKKMYSDFWSGAGSPFLDINPILNHPCDSCHAITWKVLVNGKDAQDEFVEPVGVGKQRFDIYFSRMMNKNITPQVSFGVRSPFIQQTVNENGQWSEDGRMYTVFKTIGLTSGDGINYIRVAGARDTEDWEIPVEDKRFSFVISAASSASLEFQASPGLGKVDLEWNHNNLEDGLGYNMYRMEHINDSVLTAPVLINSTLITDTLYTDFAVMPNTKYYYYYKILRTNFAETDSSKVVSTTPYTAAKGDANGDLSVDVTDIITIVAYLMNQQPQPFIFDAADVNSDGSINVLDIVSLVNLILHPSSPAPPVKSAGDAEIILENDTIWVTSPVDIAGLQFTLRGIEGELESLKSLSAFEQIKSQQGDSLIFIAYSLSGKTIASGKTAILKINSEAWIESAVLSTPSGNGLNVTIQMNATAIASPEKMTQLFELGQNYPNPFSESTIIPFSLEMEVDEVILSIYNVMGREVKVWKVIDLAKGEHQVEWQSKQKSSIYIYNLNVIKQGQSSYFKSKRMIVK
ncbi:MAG: S8 family serine peptidase [Prolixibacteraceae bacterium]|jgi:subtilisin family serine protease|nr:S8 family serine peptidase [Prolixibacteraceae bacterium]